MTGKRTPPNVNRSLAIAAVPNCILVSELDPPGYRIGRAAVQRNRRRPPRDEFHHGGIARLARQILPGTIGVRRPAARPE
jgi:hypothetical protein